MGAPPRRKRGLRGPSAVEPGFPSYPIRSAQRHPRAGQARFAEPPRATPKEEIIPDKLSFIGNDFQARGTEHVAKLETAAPKGQASRRHPERREVPPGTPNWV